MGYVAVKRLANTHVISDPERLRKVELVPHDPLWSSQFATESEKISAILGDHCRGIFHIGSTAIPNIYAKPIIDILVLVDDLSIIDSFDTQFETLAYHCMGEYGIPGRRYYWKGQQPRSHHIHLFEQHDPEAIRHLGFKDHLLTHPDAAQGYSWIKRCLAKQFADDIEAYINGKASFIQMIDYRAGTAKPQQLNASDHIQLGAPNPNWKKLAIAEIDAIKAIAKLPFIAIEHLGSTAVDNLTAKPIIDIFIALDHIDQADAWIKPLEALGYLYWAVNPDKLHRRFFKGMPPCGQARTHHVHIMAMGNDFKRRVAFRDKLGNDPKLRQNYQDLKTTLAQQYPDDREAYTDGKKTFIDNVL